MRIKRTLSGYPVMGRAKDANGDLAPIGRPSTAKTRQIFLKQSGTTADSQRPIGATWQGSGRRAEEVPRPSRTPEGVPVHESPGLEVDENWERNETTRPPGRPFTGCRYVDLALTVSLMGSPRSRTASAERIHGAHSGKSVVPLAVHPGTTNLSTPRCVRPGWA